MVSHVISHFIYLTSYIHFMFTPSRHLPFYVLYICPYIRIYPVSMFYTYFLSLLNTYYLLSIITSYLPSYHYFVSPLLNFTFYPTACSHFTYHLIRRFIHPFMSILYSSLHISLLITHHISNAYLTSYPHLISRFILYFASHLMSLLLSSL